MNSEEKDAANQLKQMIGVIGFEMVNTVVDDLSEILGKRTEKNHILVEAALDGYILALSRIVELKVGWQCVLEVFKKNNSSVPSKYHKLFNIPETEVEEKINDTVSDTSRPSSK